MRDGFTFQGRQQMTPPQQAEFDNVKKDCEELFGAYIMYNGAEQVFDSLFYFDPLKTVKKQL